jgi:hypothetical protein
MRERNGSPFRNSCTAVADPNGVCTLSPLVEARQRHVGRHRQGRRAFRVLGPATSE